jgi:hypothetical protein
MLVPINRKKFEELIPLSATGAQYKYCWGKFQDFLQRILISIAALASILLLRVLFPIEELRGISFFIGLFALVYWLWSPVLQASLRNYQYRRYKYAGFFRGEVLDLYLTDEVVSTEENVNDRGDLVIVENRERRFNLEVGDESGFVTHLQVPLQREHQAIRIGDPAEMLVLSSRPDLSRIAKISDIYVPGADVWVSDYPYLRRDAFQAVSRELDSVDLAEVYEEEDFDSGFDRDFDDRPNRRVKLERRQDEFDELDEVDIPPRRRLRNEDVERNDRPTPRSSRSRKRTPKTGAVDPERWNR